jgi:aldose 1-epimerase
MKLRKEAWGMYQGNNVDMITITDESGHFMVSLTNIGASILQVRCPDKNGNVEDIHYGRTAPEEFDSGDGSCLGATVGRVLSLIMYARFSIEGKVHKLTANVAGAHTMHGGKEGFDRKMWTIEQAEIVNDIARITFQYTSPDGEEGFPGNLTARVSYEIAPMQITYILTATTDQPTIVNMTNHGYWNLDGLYRTIDDLQLSVNAGKYVNYSAGKIAVQTIGSLLHLTPKNPTPPMKILPVDGTSVDLRTEKRIGDIFANHGNLDTNFLIDRKIPYQPNRSNELTLAATLKSPKTGRVLTLYSTEPGLIVYSGNDMGKVLRAGKPCPTHGAICLEPAKPTNSIHFPEFAPWVILRPGENYEHRTEIHFEIQK